MKRTTTRPAPRARRVKAASTAPAASLQQRVSQLEAQLAEATSALRAAAATDPQQQLREYDTIFNALTDAVIYFDGAGRIIRMNDAARALYASTVPEDYWQRPMSERAQFIIYDEHDRPLPAEEWPARRILAGENITSATARDLSILTHDGARVYLNMSGAPIRDASGQLIGGITIYRDVTARRALEQRTHRALDALLQIAEALVPAEADLHAIARRIAELTREVVGAQRIGIVTIAPDTDIMTPVAVVGLTPEQEPAWWAEQPPDARFGDGGDPALTARFRAGETFILDMTAPPFDALPNPYGITDALFAPMMFAGRLVGMLSLDYSGQRHAFTDQEVDLVRGVTQLAAVVLERTRLLTEREVARAEVLALQQANNRMDEFLGVASHELRTPLTSLKINLQVIQRRLKAMQEHDASPTKLAAALDRAEHMERQEHRLERLVMDLLDASRIQSGKLQLNPEPCDLVPIIRDAVRDQQEAYPDRDIALVDARDLHVPLVADPDRLEQVVTNYLNNAVKYTPPEASIAITITPEPGCVRVAVTDHGPGLPPTEIPRIWDRFHQVPNVDRQEGSHVGLGLGLFICKSIIDLHGGQVGVTSAPGQGATFWFTLPRP